MIFGGARWKRYGQTKLANAAFTAALHEKLQKRGSKIKSLVAHPGLSNTELQVTTIKDGGMAKKMTRFMMKRSQSEEDGSIGILSCICLPEAKSGQFWGPGKGMMAMKGKAKPFKLEKTYNETNRSLEQMRFIDHNIDIFVGYTDDNPLSIDTREDLERIRKIL